MGDVARQYACKRSRAQHILDARQIDTNLPAALQLPVLYVYAQFHHRHYLREHHVTQCKLVHYSAI